MKQLQGRTALVTGASGGLGRVLALALAREGVGVAASGRRVDRLADVVAELRALGVRAEAVPGDLTDPGQAESLIARAEAAVGPLDLLVNNAGVENVSAFTRLDPGELTAMVDVNLTAPLLLTRRVLPGMLDRGRGHVVFISSLAGKIGPAYCAPYAATKAGLVGLTESLRAEYAGSPVGFSVVCPGFIAGDGMYQRMTEQGIRSGRITGETSPEKVAAAVIRAIRRDRPEIVESGVPIRPVLALAQIAPGLVERLALRFGATAMFRRLIEDRGRVEPGR
ncbi:MULTISPECIES: SDR family oxidoreductase [unclassified Rhodococcus (in: high G+C Gram-positive bacteria)]|uniref:SDR family NAD(P)-dependent oxidoreductase n=1 Tax=unclassified Rhodococcus (in: high G+C Gram-positive bacteria) TaxID=192944 RepID=UPI00163A7D0E|nr:MULTISPECIES: SDR family NAD(P)-dependent oxidoreductase [unclassified Rhodococcus (in: high G+C Gram-positive bacteria)]MBC2639733.1 SDR family NAD(P)-dependent oxidoreductase [Rhodococcus sp. 3A]MBC2895522.1 SDR family NAD(P)-dependent oxidoreductase [Rhodococcus sp. 4CII]